MLLCPVPLAKLTRDLTPRNDSSESTGPRFHATG